MASRKESGHGAPTPENRIHRAIYLLRGEKVMLDADLATLYGVETGALKRAVQVNIAIMLAFVQLRRTLADHAQLARKLSELERRIEGYDDSIRTLFEAIRRLMAAPDPADPPRQIGFHVKEDSAPYRTTKNGRGTRTTGAKRPRTSQTKPNPDLPVHH